MSSRSLGWCFTLNNYTTEAYGELLAVQCAYAVIGKEVGEAGTPHLQGFMQFKEPGKTLFAMKKINTQCHWEMTKGSIQQNVDYCSKDGDFEERGIRPQTQVVRGANEKRRWDLILAAAKEGRLEDIPEEVQFKYPRTIEYLHQKESRKRKREDTEEKHLWYYGSTGTGKSRKAREENPSLYLKMCNKWWDGYDNEEVVLIEDFDKVHSVLVHHLKIWADRYPYPAEVKGGGYTIRPRKIVVTSNYHPNQIWTDSGDLAPILRRFEVVCFDKPIVFGN